MCLLLLGRGDLFDAGLRSAPITLNFDFGEVLQNRAHIPAGNYPALAGQGMRFGLVIWQVLALQWLQIVLIHLDCDALHDLLEGQNNAKTALSAHDHAFHSGERP